MKHEAYHPHDQMPNTEAFLNEVMRFYPAVPTLARNAHQSLHKAGIHIQKGDGIFVPILSIHRHQKLWDCPDEFLPDRFLTNTPQPMSFIPFGAGPRVCIGASFSVMEAKIILSQIMKRFHIKDSGHFPIPKAELTLESQNGLRVKFLSR